MSWIRLNIYKKLLLLFLLLSLLPLMLLGLVSYHHARQSLQKDIELKLQELARLSMEQVDRQMAGYFEEIQVWANLEVMQDVLTIDADGRIANTLISLKKSHPFYHQVKCLNQKGEIIASSEPLLTGKTIPDEEYFKQVMAGNRYISEPAYSDECKDLEITFAAPIRAVGNRQRIIGALSVTIDWKYIYPLLEDIKIEVGATEQDVDDHIMLINRAGYVIYAPEFERKTGVVLKENLFKKGIFKSDLGQGDQNGYLIQIDEHNQLALIGYARSLSHREYPGTGWIALVLESLEIAFAPIYKLRDLFIVSFIVLAMLTFLAAHIFARQLTDPIRGLINATGSIAYQATRSNADHVEGIKVKSSDEISELAESFNHMAQAIQDRNQRLDTSYRELEGYKNKLEEKIEEKVKELRLAQEQMLRSEKLASVGQLAAGVSHELNNPLGGILGFAQYMLEKMQKKGLEGTTPEDFAAYVKRLSQMEQAAQRCKSIVENLLKFSRASSKSDELKPLDVNQVLEDTLVFTKHQLEMNKVQLAKELSPNLPQIMANEHQLQQVFTNIIINAQQAMGGGGNLVISTAANNGNIEIGFADTGSGIAPENLKKIFDPFFTTKPLGQGTGLGLSVSYGIIHDAGGEIKVESELGKGSTFKVLLPTVK